MALNTSRRTFHSVTEANGTGFTVSLHSKTYDECLEGSCETVCQERGVVQREWHAL
jgi:hypothetical protein